MHHHVEQDVTNVRYSEGLTDNSYLTLLSDHFMSLGWLMDIGQFRKY